LVFCVHPEARGDMSRSMQDCVILFVSQPSHCMLRLIGGLNHLETGSSKIASGVDGWYASFVNSVHRSLSNCRQLPPDFGHPESWLRWIQYQIVRLARYIELIESALPLLDQTFVKKAEAKSAPVVRLVTIWFGTWISRGTSLRPRYQRRGAPRT